MFGGGRSSGFRPPQGAHLNALTQRRPGFGGAPVGNSVVTPGGSPMGGNSMPSLGVPSMGSPSMGTPNTPSAPGLGAGADPGGMLFFGLPQGTEELFGAAPTGFNRTLRPGGKLGPNTSGGNFPGIF